MLAHAASAQAEVAMGFARFCREVYRLLCSRCLSVAQVGTLNSDTPGALITGKAMYGANGMASAMGQTEGFVKVAVDAATRRIAGCCAIGAGADAIVQEAAIGDGRGHDSRHSAHTCGVCTSYALRTAAVGVAPLRIGPFTD